MAAMAGFSDVGSTPTVSTKKKPPFWRLFLLRWSLLLVILKHRPFYHNGYMPSTPRSKSYSPCFPFLRAGRFLTCQCSPNSPQKNAISTLPPCLFHPGGVAPSHAKYVRIPCTTPKTGISQPFSMYYLYSSCLRKLYISFFYILVSGVPHACPSSSP